MAEGNPFARVFSPSRGGVLGTIGRFAGFPSDEEIMMRQMGQGQQAGYAGLQNRIQSGADPNRALLEWLQSPEGEEFFVSGGSVGDAINFIKAQQPAPIEPTVMSAGQRAYTTDPRTGQMTMQASVPTTEIQNFTDMAGLAMLPPDEIAELAEGQLRAQMTGDMTQQEAAVGRMLQRGLIDLDMHDKLLAGVIEFVPDPVYGISQAVLVDKSNPDAPISIPLNTAMQQAATSDTTGQAPDGFALDRPSLEYSGKPPASIIRGAGPVSGIQSTFGNLFGELDPALAAEETNRSRIALGKIKDVATQMVNTSRLAAQVQAVQEMAKVTNYTPVNAGNKLLAFIDWADDTREWAIETVARSDVTPENKKEAEAILRDLERVELVLPDREELVAEIEAVRTGQSQVSGATRAVPDMVKRATQDLRGVAREAGEAASEVATPDPSGSKAIEAVDDLPLVTDEATYNAVPAGELYMAPDGTMRRKAGGKGKPQ